MNLKHIKNFRKHFAVGDYLMWTSGNKWLVEEVLTVTIHNMKTFVYYTYDGKLSNKHFWYELEQVQLGAAEGDIRVLEGTELLVWAM